MSIDVDVAFDRDAEDREVCEGPLQVQDVEDIRAGGAGDPEAYRRLVERHQGHVSKLLWRFTRDQRVHEELVQDVFVEAYLSLRGFKGTAPFCHWLSTIATRVGYRHWRQVAGQANKEGLSVEQWDRLASGRTEDMEAHDAAALVHRLLGQLPPRDRLVLTLRYLEGLDVAETARRIGWTKTLVKVQTMRARRKLEKLLPPLEKESFL